MPVINVEVLRHRAAILLAPQLASASMTALLDQTSWSCRVHPRLVLCRVVERKLWLSCLDGHVERHNLQKVLWVAGQEIMAHIWEVSVVELIYVLKGHVLHLALQGALHNISKAMLSIFQHRHTAA